MSKRSNKSGCVVLVCAAIVIVWQVAGIIASRGRDEYSLKAEDLKSFDLSIPGWEARRLKVSSAYLEVNLLKYMLTPTRQREVSVNSYGLIGGRRKDISQLTNNRSPITDLRDAQILVRLVHGYNMVDCMRIKGYTVEEVDGVVNGYGLMVDGKKDGSAAAESSNNDYRLTNNDLRYAQVWRLTSRSGDTSLWMSSMLRAGDFAQTDLSVKDMAFPKVGIPDDPNWIPRGLTWASLRHPIRNLKFFLRAKWNGARCDLLTFLGLRRPAWASDDDLTFLVIWNGRSNPEDEPQIAKRLTEIHAEVLRQLQTWRREGKGEDRR